MKIDRTGPDSTSGSPSSPARGGWSRAVRQAPQVRKRRTPCSNESVRTGPVVVRLANWPPITEWPVVNGNFIPGAQSNRRRHDEAKLHSAISGQATKISFLRRGVLAVGRHERRRQFCLGRLGACSTVLFDGWGVIWRRLAVGHFSKRPWKRPPLRMVRAVDRASGPARGVGARQEAACDCREHAQK